MRTKEDQLAWELQAYGMSGDDVKDLYENYIGRKKFLIISVLSHAQELIELGDKEKARQNINIAKYITMELEDGEKNEY